MIPPAGDSTPAGPTSAVRTFLIADIRGYTRFTQERGDEAAARLAARFAEVVQEGVEATGGELVELRGDEALAVFASARRAIRAAVELQEVLDGELGQSGSLPLGVGMGLDAGEAVPVADGYRGGALNLAARLCARAGAGEVLASQGVVHLARTMQGIRFEPLEPLELKGLAQPVPAVRVVVERPATRLRPEPPPARRVQLAGGLDPSSPLVGRDGELRWLRWGWRRVLNGHGRVVSLSGPPGVTMSADEADTPSGLGDTYLTRWDAGDGRRLEGPVRVSSRGGETLIPTPDRTRLVVVSRTEVLVAAAGTLRPVRRFPRQAGQPEQFGAALDPTDGRTLAVGLQDGAIELMDLSTGRRPRLGRHEASVVGTAAFSADGATLVTGAIDRKVRVWDVASGQVREIFEGHEGRIAGFRFSPDGRTLYSAGSSSVIAWDVEGSGRLGRRFSFAPAPPPAGDASTPFGFAISPDGSVLATPDGKRSDGIALRDLGAPERVRRRLAPALGDIFAIAFAPDGKRLAVGAARADSAPVLVDVASGKVTRRMTGGHDGGFRTLAFDPGGKRLLTGGHDRRAVVWDVETGRQLLELRHPGDDDLDDTAAAWSPDGTLVATAGGDGLVAVWRAADGRQVATYQADTVWVPSVAFSPDGSLIAAGALSDKHATFWEVATGKQVARLPHPTNVAQATFDRAGGTLATAASDGTLRLWDVASRRQVGRAFLGPERWSTLSFDPGGGRLVALYDDGTAMVWDVDPDHWKQRACAVASRSLTREEWQELLPRRRYQPACR